MRFRIAEAPTSDMENEGRTLTAEEIMDLLGVDRDALSFSAIMSDYFFIGGYTVEVLQESD